MGLLREDRVNLSPLRDYSSSIAAVKFSKTFPVDGFEVNFLPLSTFSNWLSCLTESAEILFSSLLTEGLYSN